MQLKNRLKYLIMKILVENQINKEKFKLIVFELRDKFIKNNSPYKIIPNFI